MSALPLTYAFQPDEKISRGFVRMLGEISVLARGLTQRAGEPAGELIHEGRLLIKRTRALLWFARPAFNSAIYSRTLTQLRRASGLLAGQRDLTVMQATLEDLGRKTSKALDRAAVAQIFRSLTGKPAAGEAPEEALRQTLQEAMKILCRSVNALKRSAANRKQAAWPSPSGRLAAAFRAIHRAGKKARRTGEDVDFHAWRKKAKRLLYQLELTQAESGRRMARVMKRVGKLQDTLGAFHDGVVIEDRLRRWLPLPSSARRVLRLLEKRKAGLRKRAEKIARRLDVSL
jgi:CHAD domain-containing protein